MKPAAALVAAALIGEYSLLVMPFILTAMIDTHALGEIAAGRLISLQLFCMAGASLGVSWLITRIDARRTIGLAVLCIIAANALCAMSTTAYLLVAGRALTGIGEGAMMAAGAALIGSATNPHRLYSAVGIAVAVVATLALISVPAIVSAFGHRGTFWMLALCPFILLPLVPHLPQTVPAPPASSAARKPLRPGSLALLFAFGALWVGAGGLWVFAERIGAELGLSLAEVGLCLAIGQLVGVAGPVAAARWGMRIGLQRSLVIGCLAMAVGGVFFVYGGTRLSYTLGASLLSFFVMFLVPCFRSTMAAADAGGRVVGASGAFYTIGFALAPAIITLVLQPGAGYGVALVLCTAFFLGGATLVMAAGKAGEFRPQTA